MKMKPFISVLLCIAFIFSFALPAFAADDEKSLVLLGDSISQGYGIYNRDAACYGKIVADTLGYSYTNFGTDGLRSWDLIEQLKEDSVKKSVAGADIISLSIGGNDFLQQNLPVIFFDVIRDDYKILNDIEDNFTEYFAEIISIIKNLNSDAKLLVNRQYNPDVPIIGSFYELAVVRINRVIDGYYKQNPGKFILIDPSNVMDNHPECIAADTIHPSAVGNAAMAELILNTLADNGCCEKTEPVINAIGIDEIPFSSYILKFLLEIFRSITV